MKRRTWLTGVGLVLALGPGASSAMANPSEVRVGGGQLLISELEVGPGLGDNNVTVTLDALGYRVQDTAGAQPRLGNTTCSQVDPNTVSCEPPQVTRITVQLKDGADRLDISTGITTPSTIFGGKGIDTLLGGGGADTVRGDGDSDTIDSRGGDDVIDTYGETSPQVDVITCGAGTDTVTRDIRDGFLPDGSDGGCENVTFGGAQPPPPPPPATGGGGGGGGTVSLNQAAVAPLASGQTPSVTVPPPPSTIACRSQTFIGTATADRFIGTTGGDRMVGLAGNDSMDSLAGEDCLYGGDGADTMRSGAGDDRLSGGNGNDRGDGGTGNDGLYGSAGVDTLYGRTGNDVVSGGLGSDKMFGEAGADRMTGSAGNDRISSGAGNDRIVAGTGRDQVFGSSGNDLIDVRDGSRDVVSCGPGRDTVVRDRLDVLRNCERRASRLPRAS